MNYKDFYPLKQIWDDIRYRSLIHCSEIDNSNEKIYVKEFFDFLINPSLKNKLFVYENPNLLTESEKWFDSQAVFAPVEEDYFLSIPILSLEEHDNFILLKTTHQDLSEDLKNVGHLTCKDYKDYLSVEKIKMHVDRLEVNDEFIDLDFALYGRVVDNSSYQLFAFKNPRFFPIWSLDKTFRGHKILNPFY